MCPTDGIHRRKCVKLQDIRAIVANWLAACDGPALAGFFEQVKQYETTFKAADHNVESIEEALVDTDDDESDRSLDEDDCRNSCDDE